MTAVDLESRHNNFDFLRFLGALLVFLSHATFVPTGSLWADPLYALSGGQMTIGWVGVGMFFVISGYLITGSWERRRTTTDFLWARALRLYPGLIVVVVGIYLAGGLLTSTPNYFFRLDSLTYLWNIVVPFSGNRLPGVFEHQPAHTVSDNFWTLRYEIGAYGLVVALGLLRVWRRGVALALFCAASLLFILGGPDAQGGWLDLPRYFLAGALLYLYQNRVAWRARFALLAALILILSMFTGGMKVVFSVAGAYGTLYLAFAPWLRAQGFGKVGDFSYGLYLVGFFVQQVVQRTWPTLSWGGNLLLGFPVALMLAVTLWFLVEKPALRHKRRVAPAPSAAPLSSMDPPA